MDWHNLTKILEYLLIVNLYFSLNKVLEPYQEPNLSTI